MAFAFTIAIQRLSTDVAILLSPASIRETCRSVGHRWRQRLLDPVTTIHLFVLQILHRNTSCAHLPRLTGRTFTRSAYCQARARLPVRVLEAILARLGDVLRPATEAGRWRGHRTWFVDGTGVSMPDNDDLQQAFGQPTNQTIGCGFPVARVFALFHSGTGLLLRLLVAPLRTHESAHVADLHPAMEPGDVLIGDRAFGNFVHLAILLSRRLHGVFRLNQRRVVDFTPGRTHPPRWNGPKATGRSRARWIRAFGIEDQLVEWFKGYQRPTWMSAEDFARLPVALTVRELRYRIAPSGFRVKTVTLVTTLLDHDVYPAEALADLYRSRWQVETNLAHLKTTLGMDVLHCQTTAGVSRELLMFAIVYNLVRLVMMDAAGRQQVTPDRVSFIDALRWLTSSSPETSSPIFIVNRERPGRFQPRCQKRRAKKYPYMIRPRKTLREELINKQLAP